MSSASPIGVFDSGVGGLSVARELLAQLPAEPLLYFADQAHVPYGARPPGEIRALVAGAARYFLRHDAKLIVIACNTASAVALKTLRAALPAVPIVGMEPAVKPAVEHTRTGRIGVIATPTTFRGALFASLLDRFAQPSHVEVLTEICPGFVEAVEAGAAETPETAALVADRLAPLLAQGIDQLVLGCTHYPFLRGAIARAAGPGVTIVDPAPAVARQAGRVLAQRDLLAPDGHVPQHVWVTSGDRARFTELLHALLGDVPGTVRRARRGRGLGNR